MSDIIFYVAFFLVGILLGIFTLPWRSFLAKESETVFLLAWACFWPFFVLYAIPLAFRAYRDVWYRYLGFRDRERWKKENRVKDL